MLHMPARCILQLVSAAAWGKQTSVKLLVDAGAVHKHVYHQERVLTSRASGMYAEVIIGHLLTASCFHLAMALSAFLNIYILVIYY